MDFKSKEFNDMDTDIQSIRPESRAEIIDNNKLKSDIRNIVLMNPNNSRHYDFGYLQQSKMTSGIDVMKKLNDIVRMSINMEPNISDNDKWQINNHFDIINKSFQSIERLEKSTRSQESVYAILFGFVNRNFL